MTELTNRPFQWTGGSSPKSCLYLIENAGVAPARKVGWCSGYLTAGFGWMVVRSTLFCLVLYDFVAMNLSSVIKRTVTTLLAATVVTTAVFTANAHALISELLGPNNPLITTRTELNWPVGVAVLPDGSVLIADTYNHRVLCVSLERGVEVFAGTGQEGDTIVAGDPTQTQLRLPGRVAVLADGSVLIADSYNHRVLCVSPKRGHVEVFAGTGKWGDSDRIVAGDPTKTQLWLPGGVAVVADGSALIPDTGNYRVLCVSL